MHSSLDEVIDTYFKYIVFPKLDSPIHKKQVLGLAYHRRIVRWPNSTPAENSDSAIQRPTVKFSALPALSRDVTPPRDRGSNGVVNARCPHSAGFENVQKGS